MLRANERRTILHNINDVIVRFVETKAKATTLTDKILKSSQNKCKLFRSSLMLSETTISLIFIMNEFTLRKKSIVLTEKDIYYTFCILFWVVTVR